MNETRPNPVGTSARWLGAGLAVSLLLHLSVGVLLVRSARPTLELRTPSQEVRDDAPPRPRLRLGLEESTVASINWLGFDDPTEHAAPVLFELDQAALARDAADPTPPDPATRPDVPTSPAPSPSEPQQNPAEPADPETPPADPAPAAESPPAPERDSPVVIRPPTQAPTTEPDTPSPTPRPEEATPTEPASTPAPVGPLVPAATPPSPLAVPDDRDSTPAAKEMSLTLDSLGKPAAGEGVELQTVRLGSQDKAVRMLVGSLKDPVVLFEFKREKEGPATASLVEFARDEQPDGTFITRNTGSPDIDRIMRLNLYRWTATGKAIDELEVGQTLPIRLSIRLR